MKPKIYKKVFKTQYMGFRFDEQTRKNLETLKSNTDMPFTEIVELAIDRLMIDCKKDLKNIIENID